MNNLIDFYKLDKENSIIVGKRLNRIFPDFWNREIDLIDPFDFENVDYTIQLLESKFSITTIISTLEFILYVIEYYIPNEKIFKSYQDLLSDYYSIENSPASFEKITIPCLM